MKPEWSRRQWLGGISGTTVLGLAASSQIAAQPPAPQDTFIYSLNTATIRGQNLSIVDEIGIASRAGYQAIEPWISELEQHVRRGGNLRDLGRRIRDAGLRVESAIGFSEWLVDDAPRRRRGLENARRDMDMVQQIGGRRIAAPPAGATNDANLPLLRAAERYRALLDIGQQIGVIPQVEVWGFSRTLSRLGECALVAIESGHPQACVLADVYHLYKGGSGFGGVRLLSSAAMHVFHMNDFPKDPPRESINDSYRDYPGTGVAPLTDILRSLHATGGQKVLSLELFNRKYWSEDALVVAKTGLAAMKTVVKQAGY